MTVTASLGHPRRIREVPRRRTRAPASAREVGPPSGFVARGGSARSTPPAPPTSTWRRRPGAPGNSRRIVRAPPPPLRLTGLRAMSKSRRLANSTVDRVSPSHRPQVDRRPLPTPPAPCRKPTPFDARALSRVEGRRPQPRHRLPQPGGTARRRREPRGLRWCQGGVPRFQRDVWCLGEPTRRRLPLDPAPTVRARTPASGNHRPPNRRPRESRARPRRCGRLRFRRRPRPAAARPTTRVRQGALCDRGGAAIPLGRGTSCRLIITATP